MSPFLAIAISVACSVCGQLILKYGMMQMTPQQGLPRLLLKMATSPRLIVGLVVYSLGVVFWIIALSQLDLSFVYPFASLSYIGIIIGSYLLFREHISRERILGVAVIMLGLIIISQS